ncbi:hypothetical protein [Vibrio nitrifigilis]|uniref:Uncharacterized protein n=1 Tax=Vibrio nitrifigilis TaxID=2789781 RepID=A0ABS0G9D0_9VIBR|nr:hypothetical protein [Vibrio nitrifigilis]MBF8999010.1 hypothetical protein [Vibrio nitrifigilis]
MASNCNVVSSNTVNIDITFHDINTAMMWDDIFNQSENRIPCGLTVANWLSRGAAFASHPDHSSRSHYLYSQFYAELMPTVRDEIEYLSEFYSDELDRLTTHNKRLSVGLESLSDSAIKKYRSSVHIPSFPVVIAYIRVNMLCDSAHFQLRAAYKFGAINKNEYFQARRELFRPLNRFRSDMDNRVALAKKLANAAQH